MTRWIVAAAALGLGGIVTGVLLWIGNPSRDTVEVFIATRDVAAGTQLGDAIALAQVSMPSDTTAFTRRDGAALAALYATHGLIAGQLIQRNDVASAPADVRLVFIALKDVPATEPGDHVDLLNVTSDPTGAVSVEPFANGIEVRASSSSGLVVAVTSREAAAFVYASASMHLVAVVSEPGSGGGAEVPVSSPDQAMQIAAQP